MSVSSAVAAITPTSQHIAAAQAQGVGDPTVYLDVIADNINDLVQKLTQFMNTMPAGDENIAATQAVIELLTP